MRVVCGEFWGKRGPVDGIAADPRYLDVSVPPGRRKTLPVETERHAFAYVFAGSGTFADASQPLGVLTEKEVDGQEILIREQTGNRSLVLFDRGDEVTVQAGEEGIRFLLVSGKPIREPVAWYGPIVMNTQAEIAAGGGRAARRHVHPPARYGTRHGRRLIDAQPASMSSPRSRIGALWVIQPTEIRSTPVAATALTVSTVIRPEASEIARPPITCTASRSMAGVMLSSSTASTPASSASPSCARSSTSHSSLTMWPTARRARAIAVAHAAGKGDVVVLDQHAVIEAEAMVDAAAGAYGVLLERAQARAWSCACRLIRAGWGRAARDQLGGRGGDPRQMAQEVERHALGREDRPRRSFDPHDHGTGLDRGSRRAADRDPDGRVEQAKGERCRLGSGDRAGLAGDDATARNEHPAGSSAALVMSPARPRSSSRAARTIGSTSRVGTGST